MEKRTNEVTFKNNPVTAGRQAHQGRRQGARFQVPQRARTLVTLADTPAQGPPVQRRAVAGHRRMQHADQEVQRALAAHKDKSAAYTFSLDLPFAQRRFCDAENIANMETLSDVHNHSFGKNYGVLIEGSAAAAAVAGRLRGGQERRRHLRRVRPGSDQPSQLRSGDDGA